MKATLSITPTERVLIIDNKTAGRLPQPFEQDYKHVVVLDNKGVEMRQYEKLEMGKNKYAIHKERFDADFEMPELTMLVENRFVSSFMKMWVKDKTDVRKSSKFALKSLRPVIE
jgi:hypothetical protein